MQITIDVGSIAGFDPLEIANLQSCIDSYNQHDAKNYQKEKYYEGKITLNDVNLGIAIPDGMRNLEIGCAWGSKTVDVLAARSMFNGFVGVNGEEVTELDKIVIANNLVAEYAKACRDELKFGCTFATLSSDANAGCKIRFHSPQTAGAIWNNTEKRIGCGFAIIDYEDDENGNYHPNRIFYYTDRAIWDIKEETVGWSAEEHPHKMGIPLMVPMIWNDTNRKPFGQSRLKNSIRRLIDGYVRTMANATIGLEFATSPQKYLLGITDEQFDAVINDKFKQYVGSILAATNNPETGEKPTYGQLPQGNITPHIEMMRLLSTQFSAATGLSVTDTGVVNDANPTSSDAILAQSQTLIAMAEQLNAGNGDALRNIALMSQAIANNVRLDELTPEQTDVVAHFKNPAMPSVASTADAAIKIASARQGFANTDTFLEMIGFDKAEVRRIKSQEVKYRGLNILEEL